MDIPSRDEHMTRKLRTALTAMLLLGLVAGGAGAAAAEQCDIDKDVDKDIDNDTIIIINDDDFIDFDNVLSDISTNVLGVQADDSPANAQMATGSMY
jgi:hypoxanthine-guanine phosphoribosyltransferase